MKRFVLVLAFFPVMVMMACSPLTMENVRDIPVFQKMFYVVFEKKPEITDKGVYASDFEIGSISSQNPGPDNMVIAKIFVQNEHADLIRDNVVFYVSEGKLMLETVGESGTPLKEGDKLLGFKGKTSLYWFKTKNKVKNASNAAVNKARELYNKVVVTE